MKIHRAIRPCLVDNEHYLYQIEYTGQGFLIQVISVTMHYIDSKGIISPNLVPADKVEESNFAGAAILAADGIVELIDEEEGIDGIYGAA